MKIKPKPTKLAKNTAAPKSVASAKSSTRGSATSLAANKTTTKTTTKATTAATILATNLEKDLVSRAGKIGATALTKSPAPSAIPISFPDMLATRPKPTSASGARERILFAAVEILNADGFGALTQTRVAERAGLRQSHVTYYFPTRNDLLRETAAFGCNTMVDVMAGAIDSGMLTVDTLREFIAPDIHDRRFARLMCALTVASDEDESIKPWLKAFEDANQERFILSFQKLGLVINESEIELFHATLVGSLILDLGESSDESLARARRVAFRAFDALMASASSINTSNIRAKSAKPKLAAQLAPKSAAKPAPKSATIPTPPAKPRTAKKVVQRKSTR